MTSNCAENIQTSITRKMNQRRRSSILKTAKPFDELQNISTRDDRSGKDRRVSFANTIKIKEFLPMKTSEEENNVQDMDCKNGVKTMDLPEDSETTLQISTPKGKKQRRISFNTGSKMERFSIIPKLDHSFSLHELDDDFEIFEGDSVAALSPSKLPEIAQHSAAELSLTTHDHSNDIVELNETSLATNSKVLALKLFKNTEVSDMELTNCEPTNSQLSFSLCSPMSLLKPSKASESARSAACDEYSSERMVCGQRSIAMDITCEDTCGTLSKTNSDMPSTTCTMQSLHCTTSDFACAQKSRSQVNNTDQSDQGSFTLQGSFPLQVHNTIDNADAANEENSTLPIDQLIQRNTPNSLKAKQTQSKSMLLLASPYLKQAAYEKKVMLHNSGTPGSSKAKCVEKSFLQESDYRTDKQCSKDHNTRPLYNAETTFYKESDSEECTCSGVCVPHPPALNGCDNVALGTPHLHVCNWLQDSNSPSLALIESSPASTEHADSVNHSNYDASSMVPLVCTQQSLSLDPLVTSVEDLPLQKAVATIKANSEALNSVKVTLQSPEVVPILRGTSSITSLSSLKDNSAYQQDGHMSQSIMMSPSVFSKFLTKLKSDKSIICTENSQADVEDIAHSYPADQVSLLSSSLCQTHITATEDKCTFQQNISHGHIDNYSPKHGQNPTSPCSEFLETLHERILFVIAALQLRMNNRNYTQAHQSIQPCLQRLVTAANRCVCVVNILKSFGQDSGLSQAQFDLSILECMPQIDSSTSDLSGDRRLKAKWIQNMHYYMQDQLYPTMESVLHEAASIFPWSVNKLTETEMVITCHDRCVLKLDFVKEIYGIGSMGVQAVHALSDKGNFFNREHVCSTTDDISQMLLKICSEELK